MEKFNQMRENEARAALRDCCSSTAWVDAMVARRPFSSETDLLDVADEVWWELKDGDWREAFAGHPQIASAKIKGDSQEQRWSEQEQAGMQNAGAATKQAMIAGNRDYLKKFGYIYIVCATLKTADEMLVILTERLKNDPEREIQTAAIEQGKITRLRLQKMVST